MLLGTVELIKKTIILLLFVECIFNPLGSSHVSVINLGSIDTTPDNEKGEGIRQKRSVSGKKDIIL